MSAQAIGDPRKLSIASIHNSRTVQDGNTSDMVFNVYQLVSYLSQGTTLEAGSVILTGTPEGIGYFRSPRVFLDGGDQISVKIGGIGTLVNTVRYE